MRSLRPLLPGILVAAALGSFSAFAEDEAPPSTETVTLRIAPKAETTYRFRRTLTMRCTSTVGGGTLPSCDYVAVQNLEVTTTSTEPNKHVFSVKCTKVEVDASMPGEKEAETGRWTSESPELDVSDEDSILCAASAMGIGRVLAGTTNSLTVDDRVERIDVSLSKETRALEKETGPSSSLGPSLLEGVAWRPFFLTGRLPESPIATGDTFTRDVSFAARLPKRAVHGTVEMHVKATDADRVVIECDAIPRLHSMKRIGVIGPALPEAAFKDAKLTARLTLSARDGMPIDTTWTIAGTYIHHVPFWGDDNMHEQVELTVQVERLD